MANVVIDIAAEFTGNKAFKQAETSTDKLIKSTKKLAAAVGVAFSAQAIVNFGRLAVRASLDQQAEQNRLNQLLKVGVGATKQEISLLNDQAKALERIGVVSGGNITQTQSQLATFNLQVSTIEALTPAILDYVTAEKGATASTADFKAMTNGLAQALNGNFASLTRVGFVLDENTKKQIKSGTETERANALVKVLNSTYKDFNKNLRETDAGQMQVLANSAQEATTIIGTGLLDALKAVGRDNSIDNLAASMESAALSAADFIRGLGQIGSFKIGGETKSLLGLLGTPFARSISAGPLGAITRMGTASRAGTAGGFPQGPPAEYQSGINARRAAAQSATQRRTAAALTKSAKEQAAAQAKITRDKRLAAVIDKAQLKIGKGTDLFDLEKIQIAAALTNQTEQLGKATNTAQVLQIANDTARLNVKRSILNVEDAIAAKDEAAIAAALKKLDADLKVLGVLNNQKITIGEISNLLKTLQATDIKGSIQYTDNITETLKKLTELYKIQMDSENALHALKLRNARELGVSENDTLNRKLRGYSDSALALASLARAEREAAIQKLASDIGTASLVQGIQAGMTPAQAAVGARYAAQAAYNYYIQITAGIGDPNAIAAEVNKVITDAVNRGTLSGGLTIA
jgi:hypothetical protein